LAPLGGRLDRYYYYNAEWSKRTLNWFTNTKQTLGSDFTMDVTAGFEHIIQTYGTISSRLDAKAEDNSSALDNGSVSYQGYTNTGYYGEAVLGFQNRLFLTTGLRIEDNSDYGDEYGMDKSPRVGLSYVHEFGKFLVKPRASWGRSTKAPGALQKVRRETSYTIFLANPDLGPETQAGFEVGADLYYGDRFSFEATYYDQTVKNGITGLRVDDPATPKYEYQYQNVFGMVNKGWEFAGKLLLDPFTMNFTFTIIDSKYEKISDNNRYYRDLANTRKLYTPEHTAFLGIAYHVPALFPWSRKGGNIGLDLSYTGKMRIFDELRYYDGSYNPDIDRIGYMDSEYMIEGDSITKLRLRSNYWITDYASLFVDIINLTDNQKNGGSLLYQTIGRVSKIGLDIEL